MNINEDKLKTLMKIDEDKPMNQLLHVTIILIFVSIFVAIVCGVVIFGMRS